MTPSARLAAAIEILDLIEQSNSPAETVMRAYFRPRRYAGSKDRRGVGERLFQVIRHRARLDWWIAGASGEMAPPSRLRVLAALLVLDGETPESVNSLFDGGTHSPAPLEPAERQLAANLAGKPLLHEAMGAGVVHEVPQWLELTLRQLWGRRFAIEMSAYNCIAPVDVRVNAGRVSRQQARKSLAIDHVGTAPTVLSPVGLRLVERTRLEDTRAFKKGLIEVQDEGSQLIALLCRVRPGMTVVDYCAGAGGKTLALADAMGLQGGAAGGGALIACDVSEKRLSGMDGRLKRAGATAVRRLVLDDRDGVDGLKGKADRVLVDAPCSGTGAWRRHPESRWRLNPERLERHVAEQRRILAAAAEMVRPGGRLIYATCSVLREENEARVDAFLEHRRDFTILPMAGIWEKTLTAPCPPCEKGLRLGPAETGTDGFFCAVMERS